MGKLFRLGLIVLMMTVLSLSLLAADKHWTDDVKTVTLDNGLTIYVLERPTQPTFVGYYQFMVGGASEPAGATGIAHLLEHMMFKGSDTIGITDPIAERALMAKLTKLWHQLHRELDKKDDPFAKVDEARIAELEKMIEETSAAQKKLIIKNEWDELLTRAGGISMNASTSNDVTNYFCQLPKNQLETWFKLESDRLLNPVFREFYSERDVVHEERRMRTENSANGLANEAMSGLLYNAHPYRNPVVGWPKDIGRLTREDALDYFKRYYSPTNCIMVLVGDIKTKDVEALAKKYFSPWEKQDLPRLQITSEPEQRGERRAVIEFDASPSLEVAWPTVPEGHVDGPALNMLASVLGGLSTSRLDKRLVLGEKIATSVGTYQASMRYAGYFSAYASPKGDQDLSYFEKVFDEEIALIAKDGVTDDELARVKIGIEISRVTAVKSNLGQAFRLGRNIGTSGRVDYIKTNENALEAVNTEDVQRVAKKYFTSNHKNVVEIRKVEDAGAGGSGSTDHAITHQRGEVDLSTRGKTHSKGFKETMALIKGSPKVEITIPVIGKDVDRVELPSGVTVFIKEDHLAPVIQMSFSWMGGDNTLPMDQMAVTTMANGLFNQGGTKTLTPDQVDEKQEELGCSFSFGLGSTSSYGSFWSLSRNFKESWTLAMDVLMNPGFDEERLGILKGKHVERMRRRWDSPRWGAYLLQNHVMYADHPRLGYTASKDEVMAITPADINKLWNRYTGKDNLYITVVGDFNKQDILDTLEATFKDWRSAKDTERKWLTYEPVLKPGVHLAQKDVSSPNISIGHQIKVDRSAPAKDHAALEILNDILGGSGFRSRLMERLRSDEGLTYGIYSYISHEGRPGVPGTVGMGYQTKKVSVARSIHSVLEEFKRIIEEEVTDAEVKEQVEAWENTFIFKFTNDYSVVRRLMSNEIGDRPFDRDQLVLAEVQKVTVADVKRVAKTYLNPDNLAILIFGELEEADLKTLTDEFGVTTYDKETLLKGGYEDDKVEEKVDVPKKKKKRGYGKKKAAKSKKAA